MSEADRQWIDDQVDRYQGPLIAYATRLMGDLDRARDVVQDTFFRLWEADRSRVEGHLSQWLYTVCRNRALDELRKDGRMRTLSESVGREMQRAASAPEKVDGDPRHAALALLEGLPPRQQEVLRLKFQGGLSYRQIGEVMGLTVSHVGVLIHTAVKAIREQIEPLGEEVEREVTT